MPFGYRHGTDVHSIVRTRSLYDNWLLLDIHSGVQMTELNLPSDVPLVIAVTLNIALSKLQKGEPEDKLDLEKLIKLCLWGEDIDRDSTQRLHELGLVDPNGIVHDITRKYILYCLEQDK